MKATRRWNVKTGATRSGKTFLDYTVIPKRLLAVSGRDGLNVILGNTKGTITRNIIEPMQALWGPRLVSDIASDNTAVLFGEKCFCLGADNVKHVDRIRGASIKYCYGDEVVTWNKSVFDMLKSRLDKPYSCFDGTCNPDNPRHWFKEFLDSDADIYQQSYALEDNPFLPPEFVENLKREYAGTVYYDRFIRGLWVAAEGLVYPMFSEDNIVRGEPVGTGEYYLSIDYGTVNPTAIGLWRVSDGLAVMEREYYYDSRQTARQKTDEEYYQDLERFAGDRPIARVIIDPSAASFKECIRRHGKYKLTDADNAVLDGIRLTATLLAQGKIKVHESCENTLAEFGAYLWDGKAAEDRVIKENDHSMDQMRYLCQTLRHKYFSDKPAYKPMFML